jgi:hypothetical protein
MYLRNTIANKYEQAFIIPATIGDIKVADKSGRFEFNWASEGKKEVYKLQLEATGEILGLMALQNIPEEMRIDIKLLEASRQNVGPDKIHEGVAGCLIAFACRLAFLSGYGGFVSLTPKTVLIKHYMDVYGFVQMGTKVCVHDELSEALIKKYLEG